MFSSGAIFFLLLLCCSFTSMVNSYGHVETVFRSKCSVVREVFLVTVFSFGNYSRTSMA